MALAAGSLVLISAMLFSGLSGQGGQIVMTFVAVAVSLSVAVFLWWISPGFLHRIGPVSFSARVVWGVCIVLMASVLVAIISYRVPLPHSLVVTALAGKSAGAKGKEVWLIGRRHSFGTGIDVPDFALSPGWEARKNDIVAYTGNRATATWSGWSYLDEQLFFLTHPFSGKVEVTWDGDTQNYDLYSEERGFTKIVLPKVSSGKTMWRVFQLSLTLLCALFLWVLSVFIALPSPGPRWN
jgi:hypothetical protein